MNLVELSNKIVELFKEELLDSEIVLRVPDGKFTLDFPLNSVHYDDETGQIILSEVTKD